jgi:hypothetical protein
MFAFGGKADVAADDLEGDAMRLLGWVTAVNLTKRLSGRRHSSLIGKGRLGSHCRADQRDCRPMA